MEFRDRGRDHGQFERMQQWNLLNSHDAQALHSGNSTPQVSKEFSCRFGETFRLGDKGKIKMSSCKKDSDLVSVEEGERRRVTRSVPKTSENEASVGDSYEVYCYKVTD